MNETVNIITDQLGNPVIVAQAYDETGKPVEMTKEHYEEALPSEKEALPKADIFGNNVIRKFVTNPTSNVRITSDGTIDGSHVFVGDTELTFVTKVKWIIDAEAGFTSGTFTVLNPILELNKKSDS